MSSSRPGDRMIHQDFIARIRFSNALPPPPNPPKLLNIPNTGLSSGQYTAPGFASRLAREQPLNVEVDAELGMPLDLVGMPGVFDGDERSIQAPAHPPPVHPHDKVLLRPIAALGKKKVAEANVSFLRRTEYISSLVSKRIEANSPRALLATAKKNNRRSPEQAADSPQVIKRKIDKSFELAAEELKNYKRVKHPSKRNVTLVDAMPLLPDLDAFPDSGAFVTIKFATNPVPSSDEYDRRILASFFRPIDQTPAEDLAFRTAMEAHQLDPDNVPCPQNFMNYEYFLPRSFATADNFRRKFDVDDPDRHDDNLYTDGDCFQFDRLRAYETSQETELDHTTKYSYEILLANNDTESFPKQKAVYYYPVSQKSTIRSQRTRNIARTIGIGNDEDEDKVEQLDMTVVDADERVKSFIQQHKKYPLGGWEEGEAQAHENEEEMVEQQNVDAEGEDLRDEEATSPQENGEEDEDDD